MEKLLNGIQQIKKSTYLSSSKDSGTIYFVRDTGATEGTAEIYIGDKLYASMSNVSAAAVKSIAVSIANACGFTAKTDGTYVSSMPKTGTTYLTGDTTTTLTEALVVLDKAITANKVTAADKSVTVTTAATGTTISVQVSAVNGNALKLDTGTTNPGLYIDGNTLVKYKGTQAIAISDADTANTKTVSLTIDPNDKLLTQSTNGLKSVISLSATTTTENYAKTYILTDKNGNQIGEKIDIPKDQFLSGANYDSTAHTIHFYVIASGSTSPIDIPVDLTGLVDVYTASNGVAKNGSDFQGVVDSASENYLTVGNNGFKITGISAITANVATNTAAIGSATTQIQTSKTDIAALKTATGSVQTEIDKIETGAGLGTDGTYTAPTGTNYLGTAATLKNADVLLDTQIKANANAISALTAATQVATTAKTGVVKIGNNISVDGTGTISVTFPTITAATGGTKGIVTGFTVTGHNIVANEVAIAISDVTDLTTKLAGKAATATTLAGYGITDATIANGTITLGANTITPLTALTTASTTTLGGVKVDGTTIKATTEGVISVDAANLTAGTASKVANKFTVTQADGTKVEYDGSAAKEMTLNKTTLTTGQTEGISVSATTTNNTTNYAIGLLITGDDI